MSTATAGIEVRNSPDESRYELLKGGKVVGTAEYRTQYGSDVVVLPYVQVDRACSGQGLGGRLVQGALDDIREQGRKVIPQCWFAAGWIDDHPEYQDLLARQDAR